jgi:hypothetical protein
VSVVEIGVLHARVVRLSDRFKSIWTYHQFASGVYVNLLHAPLPYSLDFRAVYERIRELSGSLAVADPAAAARDVDEAERLLDRTSAAVIEADEAIAASLLRRFFEKLKKQDDNIIVFLIRFYLYADAVDGDRRDKLDFLFTRIGEGRDPLEFRERLAALVAIRATPDAPRDEVGPVIGAIRSLRDDILRTGSFDELTERNLLKNARLFKHRVGDLYFHPDVLAAVVELNVATKKRFVELYRAEESRIVEDSEKLMEHGTAIARNFGDANPELVEEIARFREFKERFDSLRAQSNVKHDVISHLKTSMANIVAQLDRGLDADEELIDPLPEEFFTAAQQVENVTDRFGRDDMLLRFLVRIAAAVEAGVDGPAARDLRLEPWEAAAYQKLFGLLGRDAEEDGEELWMLYLRAAALRIRIDEEATILAATRSANAKPDAALLAAARQSLDCAKELDEQFNDFIREAAYYSTPAILHQLYRSRFRLLRGFSGLWLIYDR